MYSGREAHSRKDTSNGYIFALLFALGYSSAQPPCAKTNSCVHPPIHAPVQPPCARTNSCAPHRWNSSGSPSRYIQGWRKSARRPFRTYRSRISKTVTGQSTSLRVDIQGLVERTGGMVGWRGDDHLGPLLRGVKPICFCVFSSVVIECYPSHCF